MRKIRSVRDGSAILIIAILVLGTVAGLAPRAAEAQQKVPGSDWLNVDYDRFGTSFNPQTQITKDNVNLLEIKWIFPYPQSPGTIGGYTANGVGATPMPLVVDGIVYTLTNYGILIALDASTGKTVWRYTMDVNLTIDSKKRTYNQLTSVPGGLHGFSYFEGKFYVQAPPCDLHVIDALTGKLTKKFADMCDPVGIEGIAADQPLGRGYKGVQSYGPIFYEKGRVMIAPDGPVNENNAGGRGFFSGYNIDTGQRLWRFYVTPPHGGDRDWAIHDADRGWIQGIKTSEILTACRQCLENDWGKVRWVQAGPAWGQWPVDEETGIAYIATAQASPDWNATYRPGPNLFSNSILAINAQTGKMIWYHQTTAHDLWDYDCSWNMVLGKIGDKKVIFKGCKNGILYAFDAADGRIIWYFNAPTIKRTEFVPFHAGSKLNAGPKDDSIIGNWDPRNIKTVTLPWQNYPDTGPRWQNPPGTGSIESDIALAYGNVYVATYNNPGYGRSVPVDGPPTPITSGNMGVTAPFTAKRNSTIYALDAATGRARWSFFIDGVGYRGGLVVSGGLVYSATADGNLNALEAETGKVVWNKFFGSGMIIPPAIAADSKGKMKLIQIIGKNFGGVGESVPGAMMVFGLPDKLPEPQVVTKEVIKEVPKEVVKEVPKEVIKEVVKEVPKEVIKEVIKEVPKEITKTVTVETIGPVTYAAIGVAVVALVIAAVVFSRRKGA